MMKIRHIALGIGLSLCSATTSMAATTTTNSNNNINNQGFTSSPFSFSNNEVTVSQSFQGDDMCQYFVFDNGFMQIVQIIQGFSFFQQTFGFGSSGAIPEDPCI